MADNKKIKRCPVSLQPDIEALLADGGLSEADFAPATKQEQEDFIQERASVSYWKDAWRRLRKNVVAMVALGVIIFLILFAFVGPYLVPYGYDQFNKGAENLHPFHYALEDQIRLEEEIAARSQTTVKDVDTLIAEAEAEKGEPLTSVEKAMIRAQAKGIRTGFRRRVRKSIRMLFARNWELRRSCLVIPEKNWSVRRQGNLYSPMCLERICTAVIFWFVLCMAPGFPWQLDSARQFWYW